MITMTLKNIVPGPLYEVKIAAVNSVGNATLSSPSKPLAAACKKEMRAGEMICGNGHETEFEPLTYMHHAHLKHADAVFTLDDISQKIECDVPGTNKLLYDFEGWRGHYSMGMKVSGVGAWIVDVESLPNLAGKIAIVQRGSRPLVAIARVVQKAGAFGMIIVDYSDPAELDNCAVFDQGCAPGATKLRGEGWGLQDVTSMWINIHLSMMLVRGNVTSLLNSCIHYRASLVRDEL